MLRAAAPRPDDQGVGFAVRGEARVDGGVLHRLALDRIAAKQCPCCGSRNCAAAFNSGYENMMKPYLRQRFEACTGIDCSDFFEPNGDLKPLTAAARLEAWLESDAPGRFEPGERYFFGHKIPRRA